jgi:DNA-binding IclR family transcriptional regulator
VHRQSDAPRYELTLKLWTLGAQIVGRRSVMEVAQPVLRALAKRTGETAYLTVCENLEAVYVSRADGPHPLRIFTPIGGRVPLHCGSTGKALLAYLPESDIRKVASRLKRFTPTTIATKEELTRELEQVRKQGFAINREEWQTGITGVSAPVFGVEGKVIASIGVTGPTDRLPVKRMNALGPEVRAAALKVSAALGYTDNSDDRLMA